MNAYMLGITLLAAGEAMAAEPLTQLPVDNLRQAIATQADVITEVDEPPLLCGVERASFIVSTPEASQAPLEAVAAVTAMLQAFERRSLNGYLSQLTLGFHFDSDDPDFRAEFPNGMCFDDERRFASHLFGILPTDLGQAVSVRVSYASLTVVPGTSTDSSVWVALPALHAAIDLSDGTRFDTGGTGSRMEVVRRLEGWRIRRWIETVRDTPPVAAAPVDTVTAAVDTTAAAGAPNIPARLGLVAYPRAGGHMVELDVALPHTGAVLEMFDVQGRRVMRRDLGDLTPGTHHVSLPAAELTAGVYWARVRLGEEKVTARVTLLR